jgi:site-specific DNA recombinase
LQPTFGLKDASMTLRPSKTRQTTTTDLKTDVAIYARYSTDRQDARSIDDQVRRCRAYAVTNSLDVTVEFSDAATSGAHVEREGMQKLLAAARSRSGAPFQIVLVDDLSRLSRDLGDTWQIVFRDLASAGVRVIDVTTGLASDGAGARLTFGALALVNDTFLQLVRAETHRGLEGRALAGFSTGGRCYGYTTVQEENPPDPEHPRKVFVIDDREAAVVRRVFSMFSEGVSLKKLAAMLNEEGHAAPHDGGRGNKSGRGWGHTTIRAMLCNERYTGRVTWNQSKWVRVPGRKSRRRVGRPESEWVTQAMPELAIVSPEQWAAARDRFKRVHATARGRPAGTGKHVYLISGLLRCGVCGGSMTVVGRKQKADVSYARFGCTAHASRGSSICANALSVSERRASRTLVDALRGKLARPELVERFVSVFTQRAAARLSETAPTDGLPERLRDCERRVANLTEALAKVGWSEALAAKLREEEAILGRLKAERTAAGRRPVAPVVPHPTVIAGYLENLFALLDADPVRGREVLARFLSPVVMTPENAEGPERRYRATGAFNLSFLLTAAAASENRSGKSSCAGRI